MKTDYKLDWLTYVAKIHDPDVEYRPDYESAKFFGSLVLPDFLFDLSNFENDFVCLGGLWGYKYRWVHIPSGAFFMYGYNSDSRSDDLGVCVVLSGSSIDFLLSTLELQLQLVDWVLHHYEYSNYITLYATRCDVCLDTDIDFSLFLNCVKNGEFKCRSWKKDGSDPIKYHVDSNDRGTIYVGNYDGIEFVRIYDKILERQEKLKGIDFIEYSTALSSDCVTRLEVSTKRKGNLSNKPTLLLQSFLNGYCPVFFSQFLKFGYYDGRDEYGNPLFVLHDWFEELLFQNANFVQSDPDSASFLSPVVRESEVNLIWFYNVMRSLKALYCYDRGLYRKMWLSCNASGTTLDRLRKTSLRKFAIFDEILDFTSGDHIVVESLVKAFTSEISDADV